MGSLVPGLHRKKEIPYSCVAFKFPTLVWPGNTGTITRSHESTSKKTDLDRGWAGLLMLPHKALQSLSTYTYAAECVLLAMRKNNS